jgi:hypothetical protein
MRPLHTDGSAFPISKHGIYRRLWNIKLRLPHRSVPLSGAITITASSHSLLSQLWNWYCRPCQNSFHSWNCWGMAIGHLIANWFNETYILLLSHLLYNCLPILQGQFAKLLWCDCRSSDILTDWSGTRSVIASKISGFHPKSEMVWSAASTRFSFHQMLFGDTTWGYLIAWLIKF